MHRLGDVGFAIVVVAGILVLTRPGSQGPGLVKSFGDAFAGAVRAGSGQR